MIEMITGQFQTGLPSRTSQKTLKRKRQERNNYMCQKQKEMDIDLFSAYQIYPIIYFMLSLFQLILLDSAIKPKFHFGQKKAAVY